MAVTVFVVDDDPAVRTSLRWLFASVGYSTETFPSGNDFLRIYSAKYSADTRGCIILDMRMPGMSGLELQAELQRRGIDLPVIVVTGFAEVKVAVSALKAGAFDFLEKPFSDQGLVDVVTQAIKCDDARHTVRLARAEVEKRLACLTNREREVLGWVMEGKRHDGPGRYTPALLTEEVQRLRKKISGLAGELPVDGLRVRPSIPGRGASCRSGRIRGTLPG